MACDVCQPFLCHTVQARDHVLRQLLRDIFADEPGIETGTSLKVINQPSEGNGQAQIIQNRGMKLMGEAANTFGQLDNTILNGAHRTDSPDGRV